MTKCLISIDDGSQFTILRRYHSRFLGVPTFPKGEETSFLAGDSHAELQPAAKTYVLQIHRRSREWTKATESMGRVDGSRPSERLQRIMWKAVLPPILRISSTLNSRDNPGPWG